MSKISYIRRFGEQLAKRDGWICHYCDKPLVPLRAGKNNPHYYHIGSYEVTEDGFIENFWEARPEYGDATVDHIICRVDDGTDDLNNLVLACWECNTERNIKDYHEFYAYKRGL